jgi:SAM-dependent methyltransferase
MENRSSFGLSAGDYRRYRPQYPPALFDYLAALCRRTDAALDCATGNGQAAVALAERFGRVVAFDFSAEQIAAAVAAPRLRYVVTTAESLDVGDAGFDLVTVAQGAHWFDLRRFYQRLREVVVPGAVIAVWGYSYCRITPEIDARIAEVLLRPIEPYWAEGNRVIVEGYRTIPFPFEEIEPPPFAMHYDWDLGTFAGYLRTWSAVRRFAAVDGADPVAALEAALAPVWPRGRRRAVAFDLVIRVGRSV